MSGSTDTIAALELLLVAEYARLLIRTLGEHRAAKLMGISRADVGLAAGDPHLVNAESRARIVELGKLQRAAHD